MLGLPDGVTACLFDMDGVVTKTAVVHAAAWKQMFDEFLRSSRARPRSTRSRTTTTTSTASRGSRAPSRSSSHGTSTSPPATRTTNRAPPPCTASPTGRTSWCSRCSSATGSRSTPARDGTSTPSAAAGLKTAIVSSSANTEAVLKAGGVADLFDARVDANVAKERGLHGKPAPDTFLEAARMLGVAAGQRRRLRGRAGRRRGRPRGQVRAGGRRRPGGAGRRAARARRRRGSQGPGGPSVSRWQADGKALK